MPVIVEHTDADAHKNVLHDVTMRVTLHLAALSHTLHAELWAREGGYTLGCRSLLPSLLCSRNQVLEQSLVRLVMNSDIFLTACTCLKGDFQRTEQLRMQDQLQLLLPCLPTDPLTSASI